MTIFLMLLGLAVLVFANVPIAVALGAIVTLAPEQGPAARYFIVPAAGGLKLNVGSHALTTITLDAPLGRALLGAYEGDEVSVQTPQGPKSLEIERVE